MATASSGYPSDRFRELRRATWPGCVRWAGLDILLDSRQDEPMRFFLHRTVIKVLTFVPFTFSKNLL